MRFYSVSHLLTKQTVFIFEGKKNRKQTNLYWENVRETSYKRKFAQFWGCYFCKRNHSTLLNLGLPVFNKNSYAVSQCNSLTWSSIVIWRNASFPRSNASAILCVSNFKNADASPDQWLRSIRGAREYLEITRIHPQTIGIYFWHTIHPSRLPKQQFLLYASAIADA